MTRVLLGMALMWASQWAGRARAAGLARRTWADGPAELALLGIGEA